MTINNLKILLGGLFFIMLTSCAETKNISNGNSLYKYVNNQRISGKNDQVFEYKVIKKFKSKIKDKTDYYQISIEKDTSKLKQIDLLSLKDEYLLKIDSAEVDPSNVSNFSGLENSFYTSENRKFLNNKQFEKTNFCFNYGKFALTAMTIPLKYRGGVGNDTINPPTLETGFNVNFAPSYRFNWSNFNPSKKFLGNTLTNYSLAIGTLIGVGGTDLDTKSNSPGLLSNRKSTTLTYGGMILFGLNSFGVGYAFGFDNVLGTGSQYWVYQNKIWHGIIVSVDLIK